MDFVFSKPEKRGPVPHRVVAGTGPEWCRYAAASRTGIPILRALSTRLLVMPEPGKARDAIRREVQQDVVTPEGSGLAVPVPVRLTDDLMHAVLVGPACRDLPGAGSAAM